jgi:Na+/melibiose symporter-like transporter
MLQMQHRLSPPFLVLLSLPSTAMGFALAVQISALSWLLSTRYGLDIHEIGLVWAAGPLAGILGQMLIGLLSDQTWAWGGRRRPYILVGGVLTALALLALPAIGLINETLGLDAILGVAITVALALDLAINVSFNPTRALIADVTPEGRCAPRPTPGCRPCRAASACWPMRLARVSEILR